jgi:hypothetical protein
VKHVRCACCANTLEPAQELRFLVETANLEDPAYLAGIRRLPANRGGRPVPVCVPCQKLVEAAPRPARRASNAVQTGVMATIGILSVGWLIQTLLLGPRS